MFNSVLEPLLLIVGGLLGSAHCLGMCGGFVLMLGTSRDGKLRSLGRHLVYAAGRISVYTFAGAAAGFAGWRLKLETQSLIDAQAILCLFAGALLILEACWSLGWLPRLRVPLGCPMISLGSLLRTPGWRAPLAAGVWNGFLPCGLVYAYLALAASTSGIITGAVVMVLFGIGTVPALLAVGLLGSMANIRWRTRIFQVAAICMLATGLLTIFRGGWTLASPADEPAACPLCVTTSIGR